jgi:hypothetical protein
MSSKLWAVVTAPTRVDPAFELLRAGGGVTRFHSKVAVADHRRGMERVTAPSTCSENMSRGVVVSMGSCRAAEVRSLGLELLDPREQVINRAGKAIEADDRRPRAALIQVFGCVCKFSDGLASLSVNAAGKDHGAVSASDPHRGSWI